VSSRTGGAPHRAARPTEIEPVPIVPLTSQALTANRDPHNESGVTVSFYKNLKIAIKLALLGAVLLAATMVVGLEG
jgi:hypothetical protein